MIKKLKDEYSVASSCPKFYVPTLNEEKIKNKNILTTNIILTVGLTSRMNFKGNCFNGRYCQFCLVVNNKTEGSFEGWCWNDHSAIALFDKVNHQMTFERKERLNNTLSEGYKSICEQDHSESKQLLGDDIADNMKTAKAADSMNHSISSKRLKLFSSSPRNPTSLYWSSSKASTTIIHSWNFQCHNKKFECPLPATNWNQKQQSRMKTD